MNSLRRLRFTARSGTRRTELRVASEPLPAVVGTGHATKLIKTGDRVRVDGDNGTVTILT